MVLTLLGGLLVVVGTTDALAVTRGYGLGSMNSSVGSDESEISRAGLGGVYCRC
jgi:hypothetical protein